MALALNRVRVTGGLEQRRGTASFSPEHLPARLRMGGGNGSKDTRQEAAECSRCGMKVAWARMAETEVVREGHI